jgi:WD40 repeat protein
VGQQGVRPDRPYDDEAPGLSDQIWRLAENCWARDPSQRPNSSFLSDTLSNLVSMAALDVKGWTGIEKSMYVIPVCFFCITPILRFLRQSPTAEAATPCLQKHVAYPYDIPSPSPKPPLMNPSHISGTYRALGGHTSHVNSVAFSPDATHIVSGSRDKTIRVWNVETRKVVWSSITQRWVTCAAFSPDGRYVISVADSTFQLWDAESGAAVGPSIRNLKVARSVSFSPNGMRIVSAIFADSTIGIWDVKTGEMLGKPLRGHTDRVCCVAFSPDGRHIASGSFDKTIQLWDANAPSTAAKALTGHTNGVQSVAFSPDSQYVVSGSLDCTIRVWHVGSRRMAIGPFTGHTGSVQSVLFSPDGKHIVSGSADRTLRIWDAKTGKQALTIGRHKKSVTSVAISPNGKQIVSGSEDKTIRIWT